MKRHLFCNLRRTSFVSLFLCLLVSSIHLSLAVAEGTTSTLPSPQHVTSGPPAEERPHQGSFVLRFSLWHPTFTAVSFADPRNMDTIQQSIAQFLCDETNFIVLHSTNSRRPDLCSEVYFNRGLLRHNYVDDHVRILEEDSQGCRSYSQARTTGDGNADWKRSRKGCSCRHGRVLASLCCAEEVVSSRIQ